MTTAPFEPTPSDPDLSPGEEGQPIDPIAPGEDPGGPVPDPEIDPVES